MWSVLASFKSFTASSVPSLIVGSRSLLLDSSLDRGRMAKGKTRCKEIVVRGRSLTWNAYITTSVHSLLMYGWQHPCVLFSVLHTETSELLCCSHHTVQLQKLSIAKTNFCYPSTKLNFHTTCPLLCSFSDNTPCLLWSGSASSPKYKQSQQGAARGNINRRLF